MSDPMWSQTQQDNREQSQCPWISSASPSFLSAWPRLLPHHSWTLSELSLKAHLFSPTPTYPTLDTPVSPSTHG